jgi:hypothetical protein
MRVGVVISWRISLSISIVTMLSFVIIAKYWTLPCQTPVSLFVEKVGSTTTSIRDFEDVQLPATHKFDGNCTCDADCPHPLICDLALTASLCVPFERLSPPRMFRTASPELQKCLAHRRLLVVGDSTTKSIWGLILAMATGAGLSEWGHSRTIVSRQFEDNSSATISTAYFPSLHDSQPLPHRPFAIQYEFMNTIEHVWNSVGVPEAGIIDILLIGGFYDPFINETVEWLRFRDSLNSQQDHSISDIDQTSFAAPLFSWTGNGTCVDEMSNLRQFQEASELRHCQDHCVQQGHKCAGIGFDENSGDPSKRCKLFFSPKHPIPLVGTKGTQSCFAYHPRSIAIHRQIPAHIPIIFRSSSPFHPKGESYTRELEVEQERAADFQRANVRELKAKNRIRPIYFLDLFHRLVGHMKNSRFRDRIHFDGQAGFKWPMVTGTITSDIVNDFMQIFCNL